MTQPSCLTSTSNHHHDDDAATMTSLFPHQVQHETLLHASMLRAMASATHLPPAPRLTMTTPPSSTSRPRRSLNRQGLINIIEEALAIVGEDLEEQQQGYRGPMTTMVQTTSRASTCIPASLLQ